MKFRIPSLVLASMCTVALAACGSSYGAGPGAGVEGEITLADACPAAQQVHDCADRPFVAEVDMVDASGHHVGRAVRSDSAGHFRVDLMPGVYTLLPRSPRPNVPPAAPPVRVTVVAGRHTVVRIRYDSGIR